MRCRIPRVEVLGGKTLGTNAFYECSTLKEIVLPASLKTLPASAFAGCLSLATVELGGVRTVGAQEFRGCSALSQVQTENSVEVGEGNDDFKQLLEK